MHRSPPAGSGLGDCAPSEPLEAATSNVTRVEDGMAKQRMTLRNLYLRWSVSLLLMAGACWHVPGVCADLSFSSASLAGLRDTAGRQMGDNPFPGKYRLILFGFTSCADVCPLTLLALKEAMQQLGPDAARVVPIFISVDTERDQGETLAKYVRAFDARIQGLTGPQPALRKVAAGHGVFFEKRWVDVSGNVYVFDHTASVLLVSPEGRLVASISSVGPPDEVAKRIVAAFPKK